MIGNTVRSDEKPVDNPFDLDGVVFVPFSGGEEIAYSRDDGYPIGEIGIDEIWNTWQARKGCGEWLPMRCRAEARAFIVSRGRQ